MERKISSGRLLKLIYLSLLFVGAYLLLKYALWTLMPFIVATAIALPVSSLADKCAKRLGGKRKAWRVFCLFCVLGLSLLIGYFALKKLFAETGELIELVESHSEEIAVWIKNTFDSVASLPAKLPIFNKLSESDISGVGDKLGEATASMLESVITGVSTRLANLIGRIALSTPRTLIGALIAVVSSFYICVDRETLISYFLGFFSKESAKRVERVMGQTLTLVRAHAKAYVYLFLITFAELYAGLLILGRKSAFVIACAVAFLDVLPLFGAGFVLLPWAIVLIANGSIASGAGMLVLLAVVSIVRQIAEPRLIGKELGLHPFVSLASMYIGLELFGFFGMLIAPVAVSCLSKITKSEIEYSQKNNVEKY